MIERKLIIIIFFRLLNFAVLIGLAVYVIKTYLVPTMKKQLGAVRSYFKGLRASHRALTKDRRVMQKGIVTDLEWQRELKEKVLLWRDRVHLQRDDMVKECERRKHELQKRMKEQGRQVEMYRMYKRAAPKALDDARQALEKKFAHDDVQQTFIKSVVAAMRKQ